MNFKDCLNCNNMHDSISNFKCLLELGLKKTQLSQFVRLLSYISHFINYIDCILYMLFPSKNHNDPLQIMYYEQEFY